MIVIIFKSHWEIKEVKIQIESRTSEDTSGEVKVAKTKKRKKKPYFIKLFLVLIPMYTYYLMKGNIHVGNRKQIIIATSLNSKWSVFKQKITSIKSQFPKAMSNKN